MNEKTVRVIGIDPGLISTGYGVIDVGPEGKYAVEGGVIYTKSDNSMEFRLNKIFTEIIDNSYKSNKGIAKPICVTGSGGVKTAATAKIITTTYFLLFFKYSESIKPTLANKLKITGS